MIHYYDKCFGEYQNLIKMECVFKVRINPHTTPTFMEKKQEAEENGLDVLSDIDFEKHRQYDYEAFKKLFPELDEAEFAERPF